LVKGEAEWLIEAGLVWDQQSLMNIFIELSALKFH